MIMMNVTFTPATHAVAVLQIKWRTLTASMVNLMISLHWVAIEIYRCMWDEGMMCLRISEQKK